MRPGSHRRRAVASDDGRHRAGQPRGEPARPRQGRPRGEEGAGGRRSLREGTDYFLDFPGDPLRPGCTYAQDGERFAEGQPSVTYVHIVAEQRRARRRVLVLLLLQRLQQQARERLGGHPGRLSRRYCRGGARDRPDRGRICPARGGRVGRVGRRQAREGRRPPGRLSGGRLARELLLGSAVARPGSERGDRLRQLDRAVASGSALGAARAGRAAYLP